MFSLAVWVVTGITAGLVARGIVIRRDNPPVYILIGLGILGAVIGGAVAAAIWPTWVGPATTDGNLIPGFLLSIVGSAVVLAAFIATDLRNTAPDRPGR
jgi:uncharacterized membrane protein YeaQ/YmgE (transglycosylase-associated protein family)